MDCFFFFFVHVNSMLDVWWLLGDTHQATSQLLHFSSSAQSLHISENPKQDISYPFYNKYPLIDIEPTLVGNLINSQYPANYSWHLMEL